MVVGRITRAHGVRGEVAVQVLSEVPGRFAEGAVVYLEDGRRLTVDAVRPHGDRLLVRFREVGDRTEAAALARSLLVVAESESPPLPEGSWWDHQIVGCRVLTEAGADLGRVHEVIHTAANDVWAAVDASGRETLIPVLRDVVRSVDVVDREIVVDEIDGLTTPAP